MFQLGGGAVSSWAHAIFFAVPSYTYPIWFSGGGNNVIFWMQLIAIDFYTGDTETKAAALILNTHLSNSPSHFPIPILLIILTIPTVFLKEMETPFLLYFKCLPSFKTSPLAFLAGLHHWCLQWCDDKYPLCRLPQSGRHMLLPEEERVCTAESDSPRSGALALWRRIGWKKTKMVAMVQFLCNLAQQFFCSRTVNWHSSYDVGVHSKAAFTCHHMQRTDCDGCAQFLLCSCDQFTLPRFEKPYIAPNHRGDIQMHLSNLKKAWSGRKGLASSLQPARN